MRQRVLYFCSRLPSNIQSGLDLRVQGQIMALLQFCEVSVFGLNGKGQQFDPRIYSWRSSNNPGVSHPLDAQAGVRALAKGGHPFGARYSEETAEELRQQILKFNPDHVVLSRIDLSVYLAVIREVFVGNLILDLDESVASTGPSISRIITHPAQALVFKAFNIRVKEIEEETLNQVDQVWVSSQIELERVKLAFESISPQVSLVPNSILVEAYTPHPEVSREKNTLIYPASFAYEPSLDAARFLINELMPLIPNVKLRFVGSHIPDWIRNAATDDISVEGPVANMTPYLQSSGALVVPLKAGGGTRLKVIEALASGLPVVSTAFGVEGLGLTPGEDYLESITASEFAENCLELLSNDSLSKRLSKRGLETAKEKFSTSSLAKLTYDLLTPGTE
jgi:polysaccharide biosynthesis protein PslH